MKRGVEHCHLWHVGQDGVDGLDAGHVHGIVQRRDVITLANHRFHLVGDEYALAEFLSAVYHTVAHRIDLVIALDAAVLIAGEGLENGSDGTLMVFDVEVYLFLAAVGEFQFDKSVGKSDFLNAAFGQGAVLLDLNQFVLGRAAATIEH